MQHTVSIAIQYSSLVEFTGLVVSQANAWPPNNFQPTNLQNNLRDMHIRIHRLQSPPRLEQLRNRLHRITTHHQPHSAMATHNCSLCSCQPPSYRLQHACLALYRLPRRAEYSIHIKISFSYPPSLSFW